MPATVLKKLARGQQRAEKARHFEKIQLGEHLATYWYQVCNMIIYKRDVLERQIQIPICERVHKKILENFKNNVPQHQIAKTLQILSSTVHNIIKWFKETGEISVRKGEGRRPLLDARGLRALKRYCITHRHDSVFDITKWVNGPRNTSRNHCRKHNWPCHLQMATKALIMQKGSHMWT